MTRVELEYTFEQWRAHRVMRDLTHNSQDRQVVRVFLMIYMHNVDRTWLCRAGVCVIVPWYYLGAICSAFEIGRPAE